jgi:type II secretory pathway component PulC
MKYRLVVFFILLNIASGVVTVILLNNTITSNSTLTKNKSNLFELNAKKEELSSYYLQLVLNRLEPQARAEGFVMVTRPNYLRPATVVGFLQR